MEIYREHHNEITFIRTGEGYIVVENFAPDLLEIRQYNVTGDHVARQAIILSFEELQKIAEKFQEG